MFVEQLERFAAAVSDPRCAAIAERIATPLGVEVAGRRGVGRRTVAHALSRAGVAVTPPATADVTVLAVADVLKPEDRAAVDAAKHPILVVLNKADLIATTAPGRHPNGPSAAARLRCAQLAARAGVPVEPLVGILAVAELDDPAWTTLRALADGLPAAGRPRLVGAFDEFGTRQAIAAVRSGAARAEVAGLLRALSGIDGVVDKVHRLGAPTRYRRILDAVAELESMAVTDRRIAEFLARDDTVVARMAAALDAAEAVGIDVDRGQTAAAHLRRAVHWQRRRRTTTATDLRACSADIVRGSLRLWSEVGGST